MALHIHKQLVIKLISTMLVAIAKIPSLRKDRSCGYMHRGHSMVHITLRRKRSQYGTVQLKEEYTSTWNRILILC
jgi:hypothetical protein